MFLLDAEGNLILHQNISTGIPDDLNALIISLALGDDKHLLYPEEISLHQNYPNPFNPETMIQFDVPIGIDLTLSIYDILGRRVKTLVKDNLDIGSYNVKWDGSSDMGEMLPSGMYFYELHSSKFHSVKKLIFVK